MAAGELFSRDEVRVGLPARRAQALFYLIECRAARDAARSRHAMEPFRSEAAERDEELAFLDAYRLGRGLPRRPAIQDLEHFAPGWACLVPGNPRLRAAVARLLGDKYRFTESAVPRLRAALGLDEAEVRRAFDRLYGEPLAAIYAADLTLRQRARFAWAAVAGWLESRPPFWTAFALTLTETVGSATMALPIAAATLGSIPTIALLVVFGVLNLLTIVALAEVFARSGSVRYGHAFFGRLVSEYLGREGTLIVSAALAGLCFMDLLAAYVGFSTTVAAAVTLPAAFWMGVLFLVGVYCVSRESLGSTVASALVVGAINLSAILIVALIALPRLEFGYLLRMDVPFVGGGTAAPEALQLILGVILAAYFGHISIGNCAQTVLRRDPSAQSLIRGAAAAQAVALVFYCLWVFAVNGALPPDELGHQHGTALVPLAEHFGPVVQAFGTIYIVLGIGMTSVHASFALANLVGERLSRADRRVEPDAGAEPPDGPGRPGPLGPRVRFLVMLSPVVAGFVLAEWLLLSDVTSFSALLSLTGVIPAALLAGVFSALLLVSLRRRGDIALPGMATWLAHPLVVGGIYLVFLGSPLAHSLFIWQNPLERVIGVAVVLAVAGATVAMIRRGAFRPRAVVEVRAEEATPRTTLSVVVGGLPVSGRVRATAADGEMLHRESDAALPPLASLREIALRVPTGQANELKLWVHGVTPDGESEARPARIEVRGAGAEHHFQLTETAEHVAVPVTGGDYDVYIRLPEAPGGEPLRPESDVVGTGRRRTDRGSPGRA